MTLAVRVELNELGGSRWPTLDAPSPAADLFCRAGSSVMQRTFDTV